MYCNVFIYFTIILNNIVFQYTHALIYALMDNMCLHMFALLQI